MESFRGELLSRGEVPQADLPPGLGGSGGGGASFDRLPLGADPSHG